MSLRVLRAAPALAACWAAALALDAPLATGCKQACRREEPCLDWVRLDQRYQLEVVQHFGPELYGSTYPFAVVPGQPRTCGEAFDLAPGDALQLTAARRSTAGTDDQCTGCYDVVATADVPEVTFTGGDDWLGVLGSGQLAATGRATLRPGCTGTYMIGVTQLWEPFRRRSPDAAATDYVLFRLFRTDTPEACSAPGSELLEADGECWDAWAVRIRDGSGALISQDLAMIGDAGGS